MRPIEFELQITLNTGNPVQLRKLLKTFWTVMQEDAGVGREKHSARLHFMTWYRLVASSFQMEDIKQALVSGEHFLSLSHNTAPDEEWAQTSVIMANLLTSAYELTGERPYLEQAINRGRAAIDSRKLSRKGRFLANQAMANTHLLLMDHDGDDPSVAEACSGYHREALRLSPLDITHPLERQGAFVLQNGFGAALIIEGMKLNKPSALNEARTVFEQYLITARRYQSAEDIVMASSGLATTIMNLAEKAQSGETTPYFTAKGLLMDAMELTKSNPHAAKHANAIAARLFNAQYKIDMLMGS